jgi:hypothetical protein
MTARGNLPHLLQAPRLSQSLPSDPTKFESDSVEGEEAKTVAEIRRWARRLHAEEGLDGFSPTSEFRGVSWHSGKGKWVAKIEANCWAGRRAFSEQRNESIVS